MRITEGGLSERSFLYERGRLEREIDDTFTKNTKVLNYSW